MKPNSKIDAAVRKMKLHSKIDAAVKFLQEMRLATENANFAHAVEDFCQVTAKTPHAHKPSEAVARVS